MITLYRKNAGGIGTWRIWNIDQTIHIAHATVMGGSEVTHTELVPQGLAGRSIYEQIKLRINSRVSRMRDKGYKDTVEQALASSTNQLGLLRPMLAQSLDKVSSINYDGAVLQKKLDGHRCLITKQDGELIAYSRQGKEIPAIQHILKALTDRVSEGVTLDGELYVHGQPLQTLASWIKREQPRTAELNFVCYDLVSNDSYKDRHEEMRDVLNGVDTKANGKVLVLPYSPYTGEAAMFDELIRVRGAGFEGLMLRLDGRKYEDGKRSSSLIKVKKFHDDEFECIDIEPSRDGWGICVLKAKNGVVFRTSAPGTLPEKERQLKTKERYIGKFLTVEYSQLTNDGVPFHPSAIRWREDV